VAFQYRPTEYGSLPQALTAEYRAPHPTGTVIAIGGNADASTLSYVTAAIKGRGQVLVTTLASEVPQERFEKTRQAMAGLAGEPVHLQDTQLYSSMDRVASGSVFFMAGGKQDLLLQGLSGTVRDRITQIHRLGGTFAGTSAGAAAMGDISISGYGEADDASWHVIDGLGLIPGTIVDQHFSQRDRMQRLAKAARDYNKLGIGLDANTGIVARNGEMEVIGASGVHIFNRENVEHLTSGDRYHLGEKRIISRAQAH
jgi:cyanophycinase